MTIRGSPTTIQVSPLLEEALTDWQSLVLYLMKHPTLILKLIAKPLHYINYTDACGLGAGGVWCSNKRSLDRFLWQIEWPKNIQAALCTRENPTGKLSINFLELAGAVLDFLILEHKVDSLKFAHIAIFCDNISTTAWKYKLQTSKNPNAGRLLRLMGLRVHSSQVYNVVPVHVAGKDDVMADIISALSNQTGI